MPSKMIIPIVAVFMTLCGYSSPTETPESRDHSLIGDLLPKLYDLEIYTDIMNSNPKFWGTVRITVECLTNTNTIILDYDTKIENNKVKIRTLPRDSASFIDIKMQVHEARKNTYKIILEETLEKNNNYEIEIEFPKKTFDPLNRFIIERYATNKRLAFTMIDHDENKMKKVFPCIDEPNIEVIFKIRHGHVNSLTAINNAKFRSYEKSTYAPNWIIDEFEETVPIPTRNLVIALTDFDSITIWDPYLKMEIRIFADEWFLDKANFMKSITARSIEFFREYFEIQSFEKLDIILSDGTKSMAAVLYGAIFLKENVVSNKLAPANGFEEFRIASEICHVVSRQWIGNVVTLSNPKDRWLHIGLNIFLQTLCVKKINLKWEFTFIESSIIRTFTNLFKLDQYSEYNYLLDTGINPNLYEMFGDYEVEQAYHVIRMVDFLLGPDLFQKSIRDYINRFKFSYSNMQDLWNTFTNNIDSVNSKVRLNYFTIDEIMRSWIHQKDYPLITVTRNYETNSITFSQESFAALIQKERKRQRINNSEWYLLAVGAKEYLEISDKEEEQEKQPTRCWLIPLTYITKTTSNFKGMTSLQWLTCNGPQKLTINNLSNNDWILFDQTASGCVNYDEKNWFLIQKSLTNKDESAVFDALTRARMISNMVTLADIGRLSCAVVFNTIKYLPLEELYEHWNLVLSWLNRVRPFFFRTSYYKSFQKYGRSLLEPMFQKEKYKNMIQFQVGDHGSNDFKLLIIESSCMFGVKDCRRESQKLIKKWNEQPGFSDLIPERVRDIIQCQGIKHGTKRYWNQVWNQYQKTTDFATRSRILKALGCSNDSKILENYLQWSTNEQKIYPSDRSTVFQSLSSNKTGYKIMKTFLLKNFDKILSLYNHNRVKVIQYLSELFLITVRRDDLKELIDFAKSKKLFDEPNIYLENSFKHALKNVEWLQENEKSLKSYFKKGIFN